MSRLDDKFLTYGLCILITILIAYIAIDAYTLENSEMYKFGMEDGYNIHNETIYNECVVIRSYGEAPLQEYSLGYTVGYEMRLEDVRKNEAESVVKSSIGNRS